MFFLKKRKCLFLLAFFQISQANAFDIDILDVPAKPGKCQILLQDGKRTIEWVGDCTNLEEEGLESVYRQLKSRNNDGMLNEKSSSN